MSEPNPEATERCVLCDEQYCDAWDAADYPVHRSCLVDEGDVLEHVDDESEREDDINGSEAEVPPWDRR